MCAVRMPNMQAAEGPSIVMLSGVEASLRDPFPAMGSTASNVTALIAVLRQRSDNDDMDRDRKYYCVYIMGSLSGTLYIGFSGHLHRRIFQHKFHHFEGFTDKYDVTRLLYWESYDDVHRALARETQLKGWRREKKVALIAKKNPQWVDLAAESYPWMKSAGSRDASTPR
jgi:putative endonuclease